MIKISDLMRDLHQECDNRFTDAEIAVAQGNWNAAAECFERFCDALEQHFEVEETVLFPAFEKERGAGAGGTQALSRQHLQISELVAPLSAAIERRDSADFMNRAEALFALMLQHHATEDQVIYPMMDQILSERSEALVAEITGLTDED
jgi:hemerythrin-like domain-containing protein